MKDTGVWAKSFENLKVSFEKSFQFDEQYQYNKNIEINSMKKIFHDTFVLWKVILLDL